MTRQSYITLHYYDQAVTDLIMEKYRYDRMSALRKFVESDTHKMLENLDNGLNSFGAAGIFDIWENEMVTGDPRNSVYMYGD